jgi:hypothetical protein
MAMLNLKEKDKQKHVLAGMIVAGLLYPLIGHYAVLAAIVVGLAKEYIVDEIWPIGEPDVWDAVATALGALLVGGVVGLVDLAQISGLLN